MPDIPDGFGHLVSPYEHLAWLVQAGLDWSEYGEGQPLADQAAYVISYPVPALKTILVTEISVAATDSDALFYAYIIDYTLNEIRFIMAAKSGLHEIFPQTLPFPAGHLLRLAVHNLEATQQSFAGALNGYKL